MQMFSKYEFIWLQAVVIWCDLQNISINIRMLTAF